MISASKFYSILNSLKRKGFVREYAVALGGRGGLTTFLEIAPTGCEVIDVKPKPRLTRGGNFVTDIWIHKISEHLRKIISGWKISIEKEIQNKFMDLVIEGINQPFILALELESSEANLKNNIEKDTEKIDFLIEACINEQVASKAEKIVKAISEEKQNKIGFCLLSRLLKCSKLSEVVDSDLLKERGL